MDIKPFFGDLPRSYKRVTVSVHAQDGTGETVGITCLERNKTPDSPVDLITERVSVQVPGNNGIRRPGKTTVVLAGVLKHVSGRKIIDRGCGGWRKGDTVVENHTALDNIPLFHIVVCPRNKCSGARGAVWEGVQREDAQQAMMLTEYNCLIMADIH